MVRNRTSTGFLECAVGVAQSNYSRGVAQWLTRNVRDLEVGGSNPPPPDGARPLNPSQTNEDTTPTTGVQQAPGTLSSTKGQETSTPRALKRTQGCLRRKLSPPATPAATDQRGGRFCIRMLDETQGFQDTLVSRRSSSNVNTPRRTAAITASRLDLTFSLRRRFVEWFRTVCGLSPISTAYTVTGQQPHDAAPEPHRGSFPASRQESLRTY